MTTICEGCKKLRRQLTAAQENNHARNLQLDALHHVWCSGGCKTGVHRYLPGRLTEELVSQAEAEVKRMRQWLRNSQQHDPYMTHPLMLRLWRRLGSITRRQELWYRVAGWFLRTNERLCRPAVSIFDHVFWIALFSLNVFFDPESRMVGSLALIVAILTHQAAKWFRLRLEQRGAQ